MMTLGLQFTDHHDRQDDVVLGEPAQSPGIAQQDGRVDDIGALTRV
jgi:hypothetical protein